MKNQIVIPAIYTMFESVVTKKEERAIKHPNDESPLISVYMITWFNRYIYNALNDPALHRDKDF